MITRNVSIRLAKDDLAWIERLAQANQIRTSAMIRALLRAVRIASEEGRLDSLELGVLNLR